MSGVLGGFVGFWGVLPGFVGFCRVLFFAFTCFTVLLVGLGGAGGDGGLGWGGLRQNSNFEGLYRPKTSRIEILKAWESLDMDPKTLDFKF